jgi:hypothetical protein
MKKILLRKRYRGIINIRGSVSYDMEGEDGRTAEKI